MQGLLKRNDVLLLNNSRVGDLVDRIYPIELEIKDATDAYRSTSYLDIGSEGRLRTKLYDKRYNLSFPIVNFPFICSNIPAAPAYGVYISQLIRYSRGCGSYQYFLYKGLLLTSFSVRGSCCSIFCFICMFCKSLVVLLCFFFW